MKAHQLTLLVLATSAVLGAPVAMATETENETVSVVSHSDNPAKHSDGRQIAAILPLPVAPHVTAKPITGVSASHVPTSESAGTHWRKVTFTVPSSLGEAADFCGLTANQSGKIATQKFLQTSAWLNAFIKQMSAPPRMTPALEISQVTPKPKLQTVSFNNKHWYMPDGRVKTLTIR